MLKDIANNPLIDDIWEKWQAVLEPLRSGLNSLKATSWEEWEIPRKALDPWSERDAKIWAIAHSEQQPLSNRQEALNALNHNLGRAFTLDTLPPEPGDPWAEDSHRCSYPMVGSAHRPAEGNRRQHRRARGCRISLR